MNSMDHSDELSALRAENARLIALLESHNAAADMRLAAARLPRDGIQGGF
ncbi:MAG: hypothetical protein AB1766_06125 [Pseudomonadota bacterium]